MRNPFTLLGTAVSRLFTRPTPAPVHKPTPRLEVRNVPTPEPYTVHIGPVRGEVYDPSSGHKATQAKRTARKRQRQSTRVFVRTLSQARG